MTIVDGSCSASPQGCCQGDVVICAQPPQISRHPWCFGPDTPSKPQAEIARPLRLRPEVPKIYLIDLVVGRIKTRPRPFSALASSQEASDPAPCNLQTLLLSTRPSGQNRQLVFHTPTCLERLADVLSHPHHEPRRAQCACSPSSCFPARSSFANCRNLYHVASVYAISPPALPENDKDELNDGRAACRIPWTILEGIHATETRLETPKALVAADGESSELDEGRGRELDGILLGTSEDGELDDQVNETWSLSKLPGRDK